MKQLLSRILSFTCFAAVVVACLWFAAFSFPQVETHLVAKRSDEGGLRLRTEEFESLYTSPKDSLDFLFLGSSLSLPTHCRFWIEPDVPVLPENGD